MTTRTEAQQEASRRNGALSRGPRTPEGKAISSRNAEKHGMNAHPVVLRTESRELFDQLMADYVAEFQPQTRFEHDLVSDLVSARWRLNRIVTMETADLDGEIEQQRSAVDSDFQYLDEAMRAARAFRKLGAASDYARYESRLRRTIQSIESRLAALAKSKNRQNEPEPCPAER